MKKLGIDLSLRSTGLCFSDSKDVQFALINNKHDEEGLLMANAADVLAFIGDRKIDVINLEGLSFGSLSGSKDILAGNFWYLRVKLKEAFPDVLINIVPVLSWRSPLFNKDERKEMKDAEKEVKLLKTKLKGIKGKARAEAVVGHEAVILKSSVKYQTFLKCPAKIQKQILDITTKDAKYDLTDAYFLALYEPKKP